MMKRYEGSPFFPDSQEWARGWNDRADGKSLPPAGSRSAKYDEGWNAHSLHGVSL